MSPFGWALLTAVFWGITPMLEKFGLEGAVDPTAGMIIRSLGVLVGALCFLPFCSQMGSRLKDQSPRAWLFLALGGITASVIGQLCFYRALKDGEISRVVPVAASYPAIAFFLGLFIWKESLTFGKACGVVLVIAGAYLLR